MAIKSLTITEDAYEALKTIKHGDESFSEAILRIAENRSKIIKKYFGILKRSGKEVREWEDRLQERRRDMTSDFQKKMKMIQDIRGR